MGRTFLGSQGSAKNRFMLTGGGQAYWRRYAPTVYSPLQVDSLTELEWTTVTKCLYVYACSMNVLNEPYIFGFMSCNVSFT
jgi:hypothetical protein